jgi:hypothetical protein
MRIRFSSVIALTLALAILAAVPVHAAPRSPGHAARVGLLSRFVKLVADLPGKLFPAWDQEGAVIDPFGKPSSTTPAQGNTAGDTSADGEAAAN